MVEFKIGADPEVFVSDKRTGKFVCAHDMVPGTKYEPYKVPYGAVQVDGLALEFNINPASSKKGFIRNVKAVYNTLGKMVPEYNLTPVPVADFEQEYFNACPEVARELGCDPDFNAYDNGRPNPRPNGNVTFRTASGHIHIGWLKPEEFRKDVHERMHMTDCIYVTKMLDNVLYPLSLLWDKDQRRRELYGKPGAFRPKPYGVEYRVLSNAWLQDEEIMGIVYDATQKTLKRVMTYCPRGEFMDFATGRPLRTLQDWFYHYGYQYVEGTRFENVYPSAKLVHRRYA